MIRIESQQYANLFFLLQSEPRHIASLCRLVSLSEIDTLLQTVMFTLYGNQYESREEHLLLTMFQVGPSVLILHADVDVADLVACGFSFGSLCCLPSLKPPPSSVRSCGPTRPCRG